MRAKELMEAVYAGQKQAILDKISPPQEHNGTDDYYADNRPRLTFGMLHKLRIASDKEKLVKQGHLEFLPRMYNQIESDDEKQDKKKRREKVRDMAYKSAEQSRRDREKRQNERTKAAWDAIKDRRKQD